MEGQESAFVTILSGLWKELPEKIPIVFPRELKLKGAKFVQQLFFYRSSFKCQRFAYARVEKISFQQSSDLLIE